MSFSGGLQNSTSDMIWNYIIFLLMFSKFPNLEMNFQFGKQEKICMSKLGKVKLVILVKGDPKAPFSIATTPRCRGGHYSISWITPLYPWSLPYSAECWARRHQVPFFGSLVGLDQGFNPGLQDHWQTLYSLGQWPVESKPASLFLKKIGTDLSRLKFH